MTAARIGWAARGGTLILLIVAWVVGGSRLWRTSVPSSLEVDGLEATRYFDRQQIAEAADYAVFVQVNWVLATVATLVALVVVVWRAPRLAAKIGLGPIGSGVIVGMVTLVTLWFVDLPFAFANQWWAARHDVAPDDYWAWLVAPWAVLTFEAIYFLVVIVIVMALGRRLGRNWWLAGAPVFVALIALFFFLGGWIAASDTKPLPKRYRADVAQLQQRQGTDVPVRMMVVSDWTHEPNAFAAGLGPSSRVVLWDTLLDGSFTRGEVNAVVAHELAHVGREHLWKMVAWLALLVFPIGFLVAEATRPMGGVGSPRAIPLAFLVLTLAGLVTAPFQNAVSRRYEAEADWEALQATRDPKAVSSLFRSFADESVEEPNPPTWEYALLYTHPTLAQRVAMAERWRARQQRPPG